jgi:uroporphyrinogen decarboxylase
MNTSPTLQSTFLKACRGEVTDYTPVWFMRQAGRYMDIYREDKAGFKTFLDFCKNPEILAKVTTDAQRIIDADAAILFSDLPLILEPMGLDLEYPTGVGPYIHNPVRTPKDIAALIQPHISTQMNFVGDTIQLIKEQLPIDIPLIGFSGAPFTLASYAIEGKGSKQYYHVKYLMYNHPKEWHSLMEQLSEIVTEYLLYQIDKGVDCVQVFDSWMGSLSPQDFAEFVLPHTKKIFQTLKVQAPHVPSIYFGTGAGTFMDLKQQAGADVIGFDWRTPIQPLWDTLGCKAVQGNLDPLALCGPKDYLEKQVDFILESVGSKPGHIFNLGHGIIPQTPVEHVTHIVQYIKRRSKEIRLSQKS